MRKSRFSEQQMVMILREADTTPVVEVAKKHGISDQTIYLWRQRYGTLQADEVKRLRALEQENARLKKMVAERDLAIEVMKEIAAKNVWSAPHLQALNIDEVSLHKCIRPLASELRLQPGHDEIRAQRS
jgi:putative transposase